MAPAPPPPLPPAPSLAGSPQHALGVTRVNPGRGTHGRRQADHCAICACTSTTLSVPSFATAQPAHRLEPAAAEEERRRPHVLSRVAWGMTWRYALLGAVAWDASTRSGSKPWLLLLAIVAGGVGLGLYRRRWTLARVWRAFVVAATAVYVGPMLAVYPDVLVGSLGILTVSPLVATWRRRNA